jgi:hypothetical protein
VRALPLTPATQAAFDPIAATLETSWGLLVSDPEERAVWVLSTDGAPHPSVRGANER